MESTMTKETNTKRADSLLGMVEKNAAKARAKSADRKAEIEAAKNLPTQMTLFLREDLRAIPNYLARSPLFSTSPKSKERELCRDMVLPSPAGFSLRYNGWQLDQGDCDIFMQIIHEFSGREVNTDKPFVMNRSTLLRQTGRSNDGNTYAWFKEVMTRLQSGQLVLESPRYRYTGSLILDIVEDKNTGYFAVRLSPTIVQMFSGSEYALVDWDKRKQLEKRVQLCKWLQNFTCSHAKGLQNHSVTNLREWNGYLSPVRKFREALIEALAELERVGIIAGATFYDEGKKVKWTRI